MILSLANPVRSRYDVVVIGGGVYGAAAAYETSRRGLSTLLVEKSDFGAETSANSMKIIHGGLRYLQKGNLVRVVRSQRELRTLLRIAPHHVEPLHCTLRCEGAGAWFRLKFRMGLQAFGLISRSSAIGLPHGPSFPQATFPSWYDGFVHDTEAYLLDYLHTAVRLGNGNTAVRNYAAAQDRILENGRIVGVRIDGIGDVETGQVIDATGTGRGDLPAVLSMNVVVDALPTASTGAVGFLHPSDGRFVFVVPWRGRCIVGTYDRPYPYDAASPIRIEREWLTELLEWIAPADESLARLRPRDIRFVHAGLLRATGQGIQEIADSDRVIEEPDGTLRLLGVKYTTARAVGSIAASRVAGRLGRKRSDAQPPVLVDRREAWAGPGSLASQPLARTAPDAAPDPSMVRYFVEHELARTLADVLLRRTGLASAGSPNREIVEVSARRMADVLGWSDSEVRSQIEAFESNRQFASNVAKPATEGIRATRC